MAAPGDRGAAAPGAMRVEAAELQDALGVPLGAALLERALTHRSFAYETAVCRPTSGWSSSATRSSA